MKRILRKIAEGNYVDLEDITTLTDPSVVNQIIEMVKSSTKKV